MSDRKRLLLLTVGTSLFHSASWSRSTVPDNEVPGYPVIADEPDPEVRKASRDVVAQLGGALLPDNAPTWAQRLRPELLRGERVRRREASFYSAELTTLLRMASAEGAPLRELLGRYAGRYVLGDPLPGDEEARSSWTAAVHLMAYLDAAAGGAGSTRLVQVPGLASTDPEVVIGAGGEPTGLALLVKRLEALADEHPGARFDLVVTGGYKIYGYGLAALVVQRTDLAARLLYTYDRADALIAIDRGSVSIDGGASAGGGYRLALGGRGDAP